MAVRSSFNQYSFCNLLSQCPYRDENWTKFGVAFFANQKASVLRRNGQENEDFTQQIGMYLMCIENKLITYMDCNNLRQVHGTSALANCPPNTQYLPPIATTVGIDRIANNHI